jgi:hypothetical protein
MATILEFPQPRFKAAHSRTLRTEAEIVIFPGVRVERSEFNLADRVNQNRRRRPSRAPVAETEK